MKKISLLLGLGMGISLPALAQNISVEVSDNTVSSTNNEITLYNFSNGLLNAARDCSSYSENFSANNPALSVFGLKPEILIDIEGKDAEGFCLFSVRNKVTGLSETNIKCRIGSEQQQEILTAMLDRSTTPVTETFTSYITVEDGEGNVQRLPSETTMTDSKFNVIWNKIRSNSCEEEVSEPTEEEVRELGENMDSLSETFAQNLKSCTPYTETKTLMFFSEEVTVAGKQEDKCLLRYGQFELLLPEDRLGAVSSFSDIRRLTQDVSIARFIPSYSEQRLMFDLYDCLISRKGNAGGTTTETRGDIKITSALSSAFADTHCVLTFVNSIDNNGQNSVYNKICRIPLDAVFGFLAPYAEVIEKNKEQTITHEDGKISFRGESSNEETQAADADLAEKLKNSDLCEEKQATISENSI